MNAPRSTRSFMHFITRIFARSDDLIPPGDNAVVPPDAGTPDEACSTRQLVPPTHFDRRGLDLTVDLHDNMLSNDDVHYLSVGQSAIASIDRAIARSDARRVLDLPCGYGRVTRALRARFPRSDITVCDLDRRGVDFCAKQFDARPVYSMRDLRQLDLAASFDLIWVGSLATHLPPEKTLDLLRMLRRHLAPGGKCLVTLHGPGTIPRLRTSGYGLHLSAIDSVIAGYESGGYGYADYDMTETGIYGVALTNEHYGISLTNRSWTEHAFHASGLELTAYEDRAWDDHHDVAVGTPLASRRDDEA